MVILRKTLFRFFAAAYLVLCPIVILYTLGYLHSGLISVRSVPPGASVLMGGRPIGATTPLEIPRLPSGDYELTVAADGYRPWEQVVTVRRGEVTALEHVLLLPEKPGIETLDAASYDRLVPIEAVPFFLLARGETVGAWRMYDLEEEKLRPLVPSGSPYANARIWRVFAVAGSSQIVLRATRDGSDLYLRVDPAEDPTRIDDVTPHFAEPPEEVLWDPTEADILFAWREGWVRKIDLRAGEDNPDFASGWQGMGVFGGRIHGLLGDGRVNAMDFDKSQVESISDDPETGRQLFGGRGRFSISPLDKETILFLGEDGRLCQNGLPNLLVEDGVRGFAVSGENRRALVWTPERLGILDAATDAGSKQAGQFEKGRQVSWIFEDGTDIEAAAFAHGGSHAVILDDGVISIIELFPGVHPRPRTVAHAKKGGGFRFSAGRGVVYALDGDRGRLISVRVAPPATFGEVRDKP